MSVELSHRFIKIKSENQQKNPRAIYIEYGIQCKAKDEQDKQEGLIVETKNEMIGVGVVFSDVNQPNEDCEHRHEEENYKRQLGDGFVDPGPRFTHNLPDTV